MTTELETLGLRALEDINKLILESHDLQETLNNIVNLVARRMKSDVCSLYLLDDDGETLRLKATRGLSKDSVGTVTMKISEGLTGLVVETQGMVSTDNAPSHPRYKYFRETREEQFLSFLGIPLMSRERPHGVIVVQTRDARSFSRQEVTTLSTIAWQISSIIINASLLESIRKNEEERAWYAQELARLQPGPEKDAGVDGGNTEPAVLAGISVSPGFAVGKVYVLNRLHLTDGIGIESIRSIEEEQSKLARALEKARIQTIYLEKRVAESLSSEDAAIFHTHLMILEDRGFLGKITSLIEKNMGAARAVKEVVESYVETFARMDDPYLRERSTDMKDIGRRILEGLDETSSGSLMLQEARIIVAEEILPSELAMLDHSKVLGIVTERGDSNSHAAIMTRSLGIPAILGISDLLERVGLEDELILDGTSGRVFINPQGHIRVEYERLHHDYNHRQKALEGLRELLATTPDGVNIPLRANIGLLNDITVARANGAEGVGLYRTEFPYMARRSFPSRNEQYQLYRKILEGFPGQPVTIRTLDIGGDKGLSYFPSPHEDNPFMGWRSIRISLDRRDIFQEQLAAVLMAAPYGDARLLLPMVSSVDEIRAVRTILAEVAQELQQQGVDHRKEIPIGIMIELPAAVQTADILLQESDFASIGSNDLIQYTLAADRNNPLVRQYYTPHHPAVLSSIKHVVAAGIRTGKRVSLCGEMAADPIMAILLMGIGVKELSVAAPAIPPVKKAIRSITLAGAKNMAQEALSLISAHQIKSLLDFERTRLAMP